MISKVVIRIQDKKITYKINSDIAKPFKIILFFLNIDITLTFISFWRWWVIFDISYRATFRFNLFLVTLFMRANLEGYICKSCKIAHMKAGAWT